MGLIGIDLVGESHNPLAAEVLRYLSNCRNIPLALWTTIYDMHSTLEQDTIQWQYKGQFAVVLWIWTLQFQCWTTNVDTEKDPTDYLVTTPSHFIKEKTEARKNEMTCQKLQW